MAIGNPVVYADFSGGVNKEAGPYLLQENQCQDARNVTATIQGSLEKRRGFTSFSTIVDTNDVAKLDGQAHSLSAANLSGGQYLIAVGKTPSASTDRIVSISSSGIAETIKTGVTQGTRWEFAQAPVEVSTTPDQGPIYGINGVDTPQYWSGATGSTAMAEWTAEDDTQQVIPHPAKDSKFLIYHLDKLWASGDTSKPGRIYSTGVDANSFPNPRNWDSDYTDDIEPSDGLQITGLGKVGPYLLVFKNKKTYVLTDPANRTYRTISSSIGCAAHRSIVETTNGTLFLSEDLGVCITDGTSVSAISTPIESFLRDIATSQPLNLAYAAGTYFEDSYYLSVPYEGSSNSITLEYHLATQSWWIHTCASNQFAVLDPTGAPKLYSARPGARRIEQAFTPDQYQDVAGSYESYWEGPFWAWGDPHVNKRFHQLRADGEGVWQLRLKPSFTEQYSNILDETIWEAQGTAGTNFGEGTQDFGDSDPTILYGGTLGIVQKRYATPTRGWGRAWSLKISDGVTNAALKLYSVAAFTRTRTD